MRELVKTISPLEKKDQRQRIRLDPVLFQARTGKFQPAENHELKQEGRVICFIKIRTPQRQGVSPHDTARPQQDHQQGNIKKDMIRLPDHFKKIPGLLFLPQFHGNQKENEHTAEILANNPQGIKTGILKKAPPKADQCRQQQQKGRFMNTGGGMDLPPKAVQGVSRQNSHQQVFRQGAVDNFQQGLEPVKIPHRRTRPLLRQLGGLLVS